ncbi:MAG: hypothetical protein HYS58_02155, partial [Elusimicrobia bacterium]|nr:hypothetical protein [Elusimicrobiota bacterium]
MTLNTAAQRTGQTLWGTPYGLYSQKEFGKLQIAFCLALLFHALPFGFLWHQGSTKKSLAVTTLQSVDFIEPESAKPVSEIPVFEKPKSALDFLKMALPIFRKSPQFESLKEVVISPKMRQAQPILDAPLIEKKLAIPSHAPEIKLDASRSSPLS